MKINRKVLIPFLVFLIFVSLFGVIYFLDPYTRTYTIQDTNGRSIKVRPLSRNENTFSFKRVGEDQIHTIHLSRLNPSSADQIRSLPESSPRTLKYYAAAGLGIVSVWFLKIFNTKSSGTVQKVLDGDTIEIRTEDGEELRIRLDGIDAPEKNQPHGTLSTIALRKQIQSKLVQIKIKGKDRYGRTVARIFLDGVDINKWMVINGHAWWYSKFSNDLSLMASQKNARKEKLGLWTLDNPTPPWAYRLNKQRFRARSLNKAP